MKERRSLGEQTAALARGGGCCRRELVDMGKADMMNNKGWVCEEVGRSPGEASQRSACHNSLNPTNNAAEPRP
jgi:hypothetical protein